MRHGTFIGVKQIFLVCFLLWGSAFSSQAQVHPSTAEMVGVDLTGMVIFNHQIDTSFPVRDNASLFVSHKFGGAIRISTWDNPVIKLQAIIKVGAKNMTLAEHFARSISVKSSQVGNTVELRTLLPDAQASAAIGGYEVELFVTVPADVSVVAENLFGDCHISGVQNDVTVDVSFGGVFLSDIGGRVKVRAKGDAPLKVSDLPNGGTFFLRGTQAHFSTIGGLFTVNNYLGSVTIEDLLDEADVAVTSDNAPIYLSVADTASPYVYATSSFGGIVSDIDLNHEVWGKTTIAHTAHTESKQRVELNTTFDSIYIQTRKPEEIPSATIAKRTEAVQQSESTTISVVPGHRLVLDSSGGHILLEGVANSETIQVEVTRFVRLADIQQAQQALDILRWKHEKVEDTLRITTFVEGELAAFGVEEQRVDLRIQYPMSMPIEVNNARGETLIQHSESPIVVAQEAGRVQILNVKGGATVSNQRGDIIIEESDGLLKAIAHDGTIRTKRTQGPLHLENHSGMITIDTPRSSVLARNTGGDIRIIALEGVQGDFDVKVQEGNINMLIPPSADALLVLHVKDGELYSNFPVTGSVQRATSTFQGRLNKGTYRVVLETDQGDIQLD